ncbi:hypothetical protein [Gracilibacillus salinarum]|uniref:Uncharacterized protein n=1 Tax=Gracilibacillus salinarum TaxID=2932255 RepID=A0ABY4GGR4_9BACI|nr:hypothetical protein [Gracilibacillus salinarum]UOQ83339.1 hypothetical protein MUN87_11210 [Gracilibacillus salinarum]
MNKDDSNEVVHLSRRKGQLAEFHHGESMSEELRDQLLVHVYLKFVRQTYEAFYEQLEPGFLEFANDCDVPPDKYEPILENLFWWRLLYEQALEPSFTHFHQFITHNNEYFQEYPVLKSWFLNWHEAVPAYYFVGNQIGKNGFVAVEIETEKTVEIFLPLPAHQPPKQGSIVTGILLPFCDNLYFPIVPFYEFDIRTREDIALHLRHYLEELSYESDRYQVFVRIFSSLLKVEGISLTNRK